MNFFIGSGFYNRLDVNNLFSSVSYFLINFNLSFNLLNYISNSMSRISVSEVGSVINPYKSSLVNSLGGLYYYYNVDWEIVNHIDHNTSYVVYQGHFFPGYDSNFLVDLYIPTESNAYSDKFLSFINLEGRIRKSGLHFFKSEGLTDSFLDDSSYYNLLLKVFFKDYNKFVSYNKKFMLFWDFFLGNNLLDCYSILFRDYLNYFHVWISNELLDVSEINYIKLTYYNNYKFKSYNSFINVDHLHNYCSDIFSKISKTMSISYSKVPFHSFNIIN